MSDFLSGIGTIAVDVGAGWLSRYEAGILAPGDVVRSEADAGTAQAVSLNGGYLCDASLVVAAGRFFARIERLEPEAPPPAPPARGDEATELLPFAIRIGSVEAPLRELSGIGRLSFIDLGRAFSDAEDAELLVAGMPLAAGKVVVIDERLGLRITRRLADRFEEAELRTTGALLSAGYRAEPIKDYDFTKPDCFTKRGIVKAREIHLEFLRTLQARLPSAAGYSLAGADQLTYAEWTAALPAEGRRHLLLGTTPSRAREGVGEALPSKLLLAPASASVSADPALAEGLRAYAERSARPPASRPIIASFDGAAASLLEEDPGLAIVASCLRNGWKRVAELRVGAADPAGSTESPPGEEAAYGSEMILLLRFESAEGGGFDLVYPVRSLEPCFAALNA